MADDETGQSPETGDEEAPARKNPPLIPDAGLGDGGISASGGVSGGARGLGGTSNRGAGGPMGETAGGPGEYRASSRFDLDRRDSDIGEGADGDQVAEDEG